MKKIELTKIVTFNKLIDTLKLEKLSGQEKYDLLKLFRKIKLISNEFEGFKQDIIQKYISTDECKENMEKSNNGDEEAKKYIEKINSEINNIIYLELNSTKEIDIDSVNEQTFMNFVDSNPDLKISDTLLIEEILLGSE